MTEKTVSQALGTGVVRLASGAAAPSSGWFIPDSVFTANAWTDPTENKGDRATAAILRQLKSAYPESTYSTDVDQSIYVEQQTPDITTRDAATGNFRVDEIRVFFAKPDTTTDIVPTDY